MERPFRDPTGINKAIAATRSGLRRYPRELLASLRNDDAATQAIERSNGADADPLTTWLGMDGVDGAAWLGHAGVLIRVGGVTILTDPVFSERIGPRFGARTFGIARLAPAPLPPELLPPIDLLLLSHAHFDHLDRPTLQRLASPRTTVVTARRTAGLIPRGYRRIIELDWRLRLRFQSLRITAIRPAHWGARSAFDINRGYNAYLIEGAGVRIIFGGDTASTRAFDELRPVDLAILGIGAYEGWDHRHATPEEAWSMARRMKAARILPMHHATFDLGETSADEPLLRLLEAAGPSGAKRIICPAVGGVWSAEG
ncbi:MAG: hypothetical protein EA376_13470 [Phycisphaeraceae bacterium]|nr:MAG: hypothetical protein EA376_13470 [Phycisphaeraceae bacterium]